MKQLAVPALALTLLAAPAQAQDSEDGFSLMEEGTRLILRGLMTEMEPMLQELEKTAREAEPFLRDFVLEMGPALTGILQKVDDWSAYHPPEMLENGDIIIRRKPDEKPAPPPAPDDGVAL